MIFQTIYRRPATVSRRNVPNQLFGSFQNVDMDISPAPVNCLHDFRACILSDNIQNWQECLCAGARRHRQKPANAIPRAFLRPGRLHRWRRRLPGLVADKGAQREWTRADSLPATAPRVAKQYESDIASLSQISAHWHSSNFLTFSPSSLFSYLFINTIYKWILRIKTRKNLVQSPWSWTQLLMS